MLKIAFQGEKGAFSEEAAYHFWGKQVLPTPTKTFRDIFESIVSQRCDYGIIPIENSLTGSIHQNMDLLLEFDLCIIGEIILRIRHNLLVLKGVQMKDVQKIYSHPQAFEQCSNFFKDLKDVEIIPMYDTAGSARFIAEHRGSNCASIASLKAAKDYGLKVLKKGIENIHQNFTRFLIISPISQNPQKGGKTSIVFSTKDIPGALFKSLSIFALRDINLLKIESRPLRKGPWKYWFYLDFDGSIQEEYCQNAINHLKEITTFLKVLGSYPRSKVVE